MPYPARAGYQSMKQPPLASDLDVITTLRDTIQAATRAMTVAEDSIRLLQQVADVLRHGDKTHRTVVADGLEQQAATLILHLERQRDRLRTAAQKANL
jgi:hypothetical protein